MEGQLDAAKLSALQQNFLNSLAFPDMSTRHESLSPPATGTYDWILSDQPLSPHVNPVEGELRGKLKHWLTSDEKVFWVSGKAGSGKSSLMSYIESDSRTREYLQQWSRDRTLVVVNFFFWRPGSELQKSIPGLLRSLLHQLLKRRLPTIDALSAQDATLVYSDWTSARLISTFRKALTQYLDGKHFVFLLIDGLDEYVGDYMELLDVILGVDVLANVKICLSSRPESVLQARLGSYPSIRLEDLNFKDIRKFVASKFQAHQCPYLDMVEEITRRAEGIFLWAALVSKDLVDGYAARDDRDTLRKRLETLPTGLRPLFARFFSSIDRYHRGFLLSIFHMLKVHHGNIDVALATAYLHHKSVTSQQNFFRRCEELQYQTISRSKGLIEVITVTGTMYTSGIRGFALEDLSSPSPPQTVLEDTYFRSWLKYYSMDFQWLHRSAFDYISGDLEADFPAWAPVDTPLDMMNGCIWLQRYGLSVWTYNHRSDVLLYHGAVDCAARIVDVVRSRGEASPDDDYKALDNVLSGVSSPFSDRWIQLCPDEQSRISCAMVQLDLNVSWAILVRSGSTDYVISRFERLKRGMCAHCVSYKLLTEHFEQLGETLAAWILDFLIGEIYADAAIVTARLPNLHKYRVVVFDWLGYRHTISWLSHGKCDEYRAVFRFSVLVSCAMVSRDISPSIVSKMNLLSDLWQLSGQHDPVTRGHMKQKIIPLQVHSHFSHLLNRSGSVTKSESSLRLRFLGLKKTLPPKTLFEITPVCIGLKKTIPPRQRYEIAPVCTFELRHAANEVLLRYHLLRREALDANSVCELTSSAEGYREATPSDRAFAGTEADFERCRDGILKEIWANDRCQVDSWQQLYLLTCVKLYFKTLWKIGPRCGVDEVPEGNSGGSTHTGDHTGGTFETNRHTL
jgi:hypothetical protein